MGSTRVTSTGINFRDGSDKANLQLTVTAKGEGLFSCDGNNLVRLRSLGLSAPVAADELVTKSYVDSVATGLDMKGQAQYLSIGDLQAVYSPVTQQVSTLNPDGSSTTADKVVFQLQGAVPWMSLLTTQIDVEPGAGNTPRPLAAAADPAVDWFGLHGASNMHLPFVARSLEYYYMDGTGTEMDSKSHRGDWPTRVLVNGQVNQKENGLYWLVDDGSASGTWVLQRTTNFDGSPYGEIKPGAFIFVADGHLYKNKGFVLTNTDNVPSISVTTDGNDGNNIFFDGFSAAGFPVSGANMAIDGDMVGTVMDPSFDSVLIGTSGHSLTINDIMESSTRVSQLQCSGGLVTFTNTAVRSSEDITALKLLKSSLGVQSGPVAARTFTVDVDGNMVAKKNIQLDATVSSTAANSVLMTLKNAAFQVQHKVGESMITKFSVNHDTGNTMSAGTLESHGNAMLGTSGTAASTMLVNASLQATTMTGRLSVKDPTSSALYLDIAKSTGASTFTGAMQLENNFTIKDAAAAAGSEAFTVTKSSGATMVKGNLTVHAGQSQRFVVQDPPSGEYLTVIKHDNALQVCSTSGTKSVEIAPGTDPVLQILNNTDLKIFATGAGPDGTNLPSFKVIGSSGETYAKGDFKVNNLFVVTASSGSLDMEGTLKVKQKAMFEDGDVCVTSGAIMIGQENSEQLVAYKTSNSAEMLMLMGDKNIRVKGSDDVDRLRFTPLDTGLNTALLSLEKGCQLIIKDTGNSPVFTCSGTGANVGGTMTGFITTNCDFRINDVNGTLKFAVMRASGNTTIKGSCGVTSTLTVTAAGATSTPGLFVQNGGARITAGSSGCELDVLAAGTTQYSAPDAAHTTAFKYRESASATTRTDVEIGIGAANGHGSVIVHGGTLEVTQKADPTIKAISVQGDQTQPLILTHSKIQGFRDDMSSQSYEVDSQTGNLFMGLGNLYMAGSWAEVQAENYKTSILANGSAQFNGTYHKINAPTTIEGSNTLALETGSFTMNGSKYQVTSTGATTQHDDLTITDDGAAGGAATCFKVLADGGSVTSSGSIHCNTSLSAAGATSAAAKFLVGSDGATKVDSTLEVTGILTAKSDVKIYNSDVVKCVVSSATGDIDTEGKLNVSGDATVETGALLVSQGVLNVQTVTDGHKFSVPTTSSSLGQFLGANSTLHLSVSNVGSTSDHIQLSTGSAPGAGQTIQLLLLMKEGGIIRVVRDSDADQFFEVHGEDRTIKCGGSAGGTLTLQGPDGAGGNHGKAQFDMSSGSLKTQGSLMVHSSNADYLTGTLASSAFSVTSAGTTNIKGTLDVLQTTTVGSTLSGAAAASLLVPNGDFKVKTEQFVVNGTAVASFKNLNQAADQSVVVYSSAAAGGTKTFEVSANLGSTSMYAGAHLRTLSAQNVTTTTFHVDGSSGDTTINGGTFVVKSQYSNDATYTTFKVDASGNTTSSGTLTVEGDTEITNGDLVVKQQNLYIRRDANPAYTDSNPRYRFTVSDACLAEFVAPSVADAGEKFFYIRDNNLNDKFSIQGSNGDTIMRGGKLKVYHNSTAFLTVDPQQNDGDATTHGIITIQSCGVNSQLLVKKLGGGTALSLNAESGDLVVHGSTTCNSDLTVNADATFTTHIDSGTTTTMKYTGNTFMQVKGDADKDMQLGPKGANPARLYLTCGGSITSHGGTLTVKDSAGTGALFDVAGTTGHITSVAGLTLGGTANGDITVKDSSSVQTFAIAGSSGSVEMQGSLYVNNTGTALAPLWAATLASSGALTTRGDLKITTSDGTQTRLEVSSATGDTQITGGDLTVRSNATVPLQTFHLDADTGSIVTTGALTIDGQFELKQDSQSRVKMDAAGDVTLYGGDFTIKKSDNVTNSVYINALEGDVTLARDLTTDRNGLFKGTLTCQQRVNGLSFLATSDEVLKHKVKPIPGDIALEMVSRLVGCTFEWRNEERYCTGERVGFIAQQVQKVHQCFVHRDKSDGYLKVDYASTTALLANAVTETSAQNMLLRKELDSLTAEHESMKEELKAATLAIAEMRQFFTTQSE